MELWFSVSGQQHVIFWPLISHRYHLHVQGPEAVAGLQQSAQLLGILGQQLHTAELAIPAYARACADIVSDLFSAPDAQPGAAAHVLVPVQRSLRSAMGLADLVP